MSVDLNPDKLKMLAEYVQVARRFDPLSVGLAKWSQAVEQRLSDNDAMALSEYADLLQVRPSEFKKLLDALLDEPPNFFREGRTAEVLQTEIIPLILASGGPVRVWFAGCRTGKEAYGFALLLCDAIGLPGFAKRVKIFATDIDDNNLSLARQTIYSEETMRIVPADLKQKYFTPDGENYSLHGDVRRAVILGKHDLASDPPISKMDLIVCNHVLPYYDQEKQERILTTKLHFALKEDQFLLLGDGETMPSLSGFDEHSPGLYVKALSSQGQVVLPEAGEQNGQAAADDLLQEFAFDTAPIAQIVVDSDGALAMANSRARSVFGLTSMDFGRPLQDLEISYRPVELRSLIEQAVLSPEPVICKSVSKGMSGGKQLVFDLSLKRIIDSVTGISGVSVEYIDVTAFDELRTDLLGVNQQLQTANEELQSAHEELETTNEELQSTNEELETTNEELQSTNEELETINEELQSTNSELESTNAQQRSLTGKVKSANRFLEAILSSVSSAIIVMDSDYRVTIWSRRAEEFWGLRFAEVVGRSFFSLDIGLPVEQLTAPLRSFLNSPETTGVTTIDGLSRTGKAMKCTIRMTHLTSIRGIVLVINAEPQGPQP